MSIVLDAAHFPTKPTVRKPRGLKDLIEQYLQRLDERKKERRDSIHGESR